MMIPFIISLTAVLLSITTTFDLQDGTESIVSECPLKCECFEFVEDMLEIRCQAIDDLKSLPNETTELHLTSTSIESLDTLQAYQVLHLIFLTLERSTITSFDATIFSKSTNLRSLNINYSFLKEFDLNLFVSLLSIVTIDVSESKIDKVTIGHGPAMLEHLGLYNNNIKDLEVLAGEVQRMRNLQRIDLYSNRIQCNCMLWENITQLQNITFTGTCHDARSNISFPLNFPDYQYFFPNCTNKLLPLSPSNITYNQIPSEEHNTASVYSKYKNCIAIIVSVVSVLFNMIVIQCCR